MTSSEKAKIVFKRLARGFIAGFAAVAAVATLTNIQTWSELGTALNNLAIAGVVGGLTGLFMALDKMSRIKED